ncbi:hypothetical protein H072_7991 [Dactylellina haptotyla CBS 200.50]|uniref:F-box domain-containing protein n=1 Tax=Dactylellina haptotyla (strain CBS 200.50) TaxID=1284197 RepID=S8A5P2_DACHA|nr:hypothetical protein H072_7991 [Dactylellina haptotyla CBS 200.50]
MQMSSQVNLKQAILGVFGRRSFRAPETGSPEPPKDRPPSAKLSYINDSRNSSSSAVSDGIKLPLDNFPVDIKLMILEKLADADFDGFISLSSSSRAFRGIYQHNKRLLVERALLHDALKYQEESLFLVHFAERIRNFQVHLTHEDITGIRNAYLYAIHAQKDSSSNTETFEIFEMDCMANWPVAESTKTKLIETHRAVLRFVHQFGQKCMYPRLLRAVSGVGDQKPASTEPPMTSAEKQRLIRGTYRLSVAMLFKLFAYRPEPGVANPTTTPKYFQSIWGYWDSKLVEMLTSYMSIELETTFEVLWRKMTIWWTGDLEDMFPIANWARNELTPLATAEHQDCSYFAFMVHEFPYHAAEWITAAPAHGQFSSGWGGPQERIDEMTKFCQSFISQPQSPFIYGHHLAQTRGYFNSHLFELSEIKETKRIRVTYPGLMEVKSWNRPNFKMRSPYGSVYPGLDFWGVPWDNWRLRSWGYEFPPDDMQISI